MATLIVSYSLSGNNDAFASGLSGRLGAERFRIEEPRHRGMWGIAADVLFNRTPRATLPGLGGISKDDFVLFIGPVWMGKVASPFRACFDALKATPARYGFASVSGGADGPGSNSGLAAELERRLGKAPAFVLDLHIADLLPPSPRPTRKVTSAYRISPGEAEALARKAEKAVRKALG